MNIVIIGGRKKAEFLLKSLLDKKHTVSIINKDYEYCNKLSEKYECSIIHGDGGKRYILEEASIQSADVVIAMTSKDATNLTICQLSKKVYNIRKSFATVANPKNVDVFKNLGIDGAISATYVVSDIIEQMATINDMHKFIPIENGKVNMLEVVVNEKSPLCNKYIKDINLPIKSIIACIIRDLNSIIPNGDTKINKDDKLIILCDVTVQNDMIRTLDIRG